MQVVGCLAIELEQYSRVMVSFPDRLIRFAFNQVSKVFRTLHSRVCGGINRRLEHMQIYHSSTLPM